MVVKGIEKGINEARESAPKREKLKEADLAKLAPEAKLQLQKELEQQEVKKQKEQKNVVDETTNEVKVLKSGILADLDNNGYAGTDVRNENRYYRLRDKQDQVDQDQKDIIDEINHTDLSSEDKDLVTNFVNKGILRGSSFKKGLEKMYMQRTGADKQEAREWVNNVKQVLDEAGLWEEVKSVNRKEKKKDRIEKRAQRKTYENQEEVVFTEHELKKMIDVTSKIMGRDVFSQALYDKLSKLPSAQAMSDFPKWSNVKELNNVLSDPDNAELIRSMLVKALPYMTVSNFQEWLQAGNAGEKLEQYKKEIDAKYGTAIDQKIQNTLSQLPSELSLDPAATQNVQRKLHSQIVAGLAAGYMNTAQAIGTGIGAGLNIDKFFIGVGVGSNGLPGFVVGFNESADLGKTTKGSVHVGVANFIIPFARVDLQQELNAGALEKTLTAKRLRKAGVYAEAAPGYVGAGINVGSDLEAGINKQADNIESTLSKELQTLNKDMTLDEVKDVLSTLFTKADDATLSKVAEHVLYGLQQGYSTQDIAATFAAAWKNESIIHTRGKVDFSAELGVGVLFSLPVLKAFIGLKIYTRSTKREDKFDKEAKEKKMSAFGGFAKFDNVDTKGLSYEEKIEYWLGNRYTVTKENHLITISKNNDNGTPIYDQLDIFVKDPTLVRVNKNDITFHEGMNIMAGKFIGAYKDKQKIYIGYETADNKMPKTPLNYRLSGNPEDFQGKGVETTSVKTEKLALRFAPEIDAVDELKVDVLINNNVAHKKFLSMTAPGNKQKAGYNKMFGEFAASTRGADFDLMKKKMDALNKTYLNVFDASAQKDIDALWAKSPEYKRVIIYKFLQAGSFSARLSAIMDHKGLEGSKNVGELLKNRKGHIEAFKNGGIIVGPHAFDNIYKKAKELGTSKESYAEEPHLNAVAIVGYYRSGLVPTTGFIGFGGVTTVAGEKYREDASKEKGVYSKFLEIYQKSPDYTAQKERIQNAVKKFDAKAEITDKQFIDLIKTGKLEINGVTITMKGNAFQKILNGPCANEGYMLSFGDLEVTYKKKAPAQGNIYVGMDYTENYQEANSFKVGVGTVRGQSPKPRTPDIPPPPPPPPPPNPNPDGNTVFDNGTTTVIGDGGVIIDDGNGNTGNHSGR